MRKLVVVLLIGAISLLAVTSVLAANYDEAPMLRTLVAAGELPPVAERLPEEPQVVTPVAELGQVIGVYGGTANVFHRRYDGLSQDAWYLGGSEAILRVAPDESTIVPNVAKAFEFSPDGKTLTMYLRKGMKWSDGAPFSADDILFWWEDVMLNEELTPSVPGDFMPGGEVMGMEKVDDYTIRLQFAAPYPMIKLVLITWWGADMVAKPKHYLKDFHIKYNPEANELAKENGFDAWYQYFADRSNHFIAFPTRVGLPVISAFTMLESETTYFLYERNPYYWKVDSAGNQLPYIDRMFSRAVSDLEVYYGRIISGESDYACAEGRMVNFVQYPLFKENEESGGYRTFLWQFTNQSFPTIMPNQTYEKDLVLRDIFRDVRFRRALSLAIDRDEMNEVIYFGKARPTQITALSSSKYFEPEWEQSYAEYDPEEANRLLDEMGLKWDKEHEYRLMPDGKKLAWTWELGEQEALPAAELIKEYWQAIGCDMTVKVVSLELYTVRVSANEIQMGSWGHDGASDFMIFLDPYNLLPTVTHNGNAWAPLWGQWYVSGGEKGEAPPADMQELIKDWETLKVTVDEEEDIRLGKKILAWVSENLPVIGTVGYFPTVLIVKDNLKNIPEEYLYGWDMLYTTPAHPELFFFEPPLLPQQR